jgi:hypothetical protein
VNRWNSNVISLQEMASFIHWLAQMRPHARTRNDDAHREGKLAPAALPSSNRRQQGGTSTSAVVKAAMASQENLLCTSLLFLSVVAPHRRLAHACQPAATTTVTPQVFVKAN